MCPLNNETNYSLSANDIETIVDSALGSLLWCEGEIYDENGNVTLELWVDLYDYSDATPELRASIKDEVLELFEREDSAVTCAAHSYIEQMSLEQFGRDMTLTRNGHGAGFWDRGLGEIGDLLNDWAKHLGTLHVFHGHDSIHPDKWAGMFHAE